MALWAERLYDSVWITAGIIALVNLVLTAWLFGCSRAARRAVRSMQRRGPKMSVPDGLLVVFVVPACDEEAVIADSIERLDAVTGVETLTLVVDDGSQDRTAAIVGGLAAGRDDLWLVARRAPEARLGKGAALNHAWRVLHERLPGSRWSRESDQVVVCVVDADGRLRPDAAAYAAAQFAEPSVGGVQIGVSMYNRDTNLLTRLQQVEFVAFGELFQQARNRLDTVGLGGNGQLTRLSALDSIAEEQGPWRDVLTEDQDLGIRMHLAGWRVVWDGRGDVAQQAVPSVRRLVRQRIRWTQGAMQAWTWLPAIIRDRRSRRASRADLALWLAIPLELTAMALALAFFLANLAHLVLLGLRGVPAWFESEAWWQPVGSYVLAFGVTLLAAYTYWAADRRRGLVASVFYGHALAFYAWLWLVSGVAASVREIRGATAWTKTEREPVADGAGSEARAA